MSQSNITQARSTDRAEVKKTDVTVEDRERQIDYLLASGRKLLDHSEMTLATNVYTNVLKMDPNNPEALRGLGICFEKKDKLDKATLCYKKWAMLTRSPEAYAKLSGIYFKQNDDASALECLKKCLSSNATTDDDRYEIFNHMGNACLRRNDVVSAEKHYREALKIRPRSDRTIVNLGSLAFHQSNWDAALTHYHDALKINPKNTKALCGLGIIAQEKRQWKDALTCFSRALDQEWENMVAIHGIIRSGQQLSQFEIIEKYLKRYLAHHPSNVAILYCLAGNYFHQKAWGKCREEIQKIELLEPYHGPTAELKELLRQAEGV